MVLQPPKVRAKYNYIVGLLEEFGWLTSPHAEKVAGTTGLFAITIRGKNNVRVFYAYAAADVVYGLHAYEKKRMSIPHQELKHALTLLAHLTRE